MKLMSEPIRPFQVSIAPTALDEPLPPPDGEELSLDEIEAAYLRALETADAVELPLLEAPNVSEPQVSPALPGTASARVPSATVNSGATAANDEPPDPVRIVEAFLFVGQAPLSARKLHDLLGGRQSAESVEEAILSLNDEYASQGRPYEITSSEGGYRLSLRSEFEAVRRRVYGQGPKEVKLNQEALEVLAVIAYRQPVSPEMLTETGRANVPVLVRQLLRRQLIELQRGPEQQELYRTTKRFLELFSLRSLDDLPRAADFQFK